METQRRSTLKKLFASLAGAIGVTTAAKAAPATTPKEVGEVVLHQDKPLYSVYTKYNNMIFMSGKGAHFEGDVVAHSHHVLDELERDLKKAGSSMDKVLKVSVFLHDLNDYKAMNDVYRGRFGDKPPCRTTVAVYAGVPNDSWVEIDCIAYI